MERLTKRMDHDIIMAPGYDFGIDPNDYDVVQKVLVRLAAYEDTNLTPEEITAPFTEETMLKMTARYLGIEPDRLIEVAKWMQRKEWPEWKQRLLQSFMRGANEWRNNGEKSV